MSSFYFYLAIVLLKLVHEFQVFAVPTCIIIDTDTIHRSQDDITITKNNSTSSILLRNLRMLDHQRSSGLSELILEPIPLSYVDTKQTSPPALIELNDSTLKKSLALDPIPERSFAPCPIESLNQLETQMVVPFEFRRIRIEQPDHHTKFLEDDPRENVPDLSTAVYERRSDPDGVRFCRTCRDGLWTQLTVCETVRCDAELLRANPRLVSEWGEIKPIDGGALYAPSAVFAIYAFAFGPHCKRCESNGQWSRYALPELCSGIKFFGHSTTPATAAVVTKTMKTTFVNNMVSKTKPNATVPSAKPIGKRQ